MFSHGCCLPGTKQRLDPACWVFILWYVHTFHLWLLNLPKYKFFKYFEHSGKFMLVINWRAECTAFESFVPLFLQVVNNILGFPVGLGRLYTWHHTLHFDFWHPMRKTIFVMDYMYMYMQQTPLSQITLKGRSRGVDWVSSHPPLWGHLSLKLRGGTKLSLSLSITIYLGLFRYPSVRSAPLPWKILDPALSPKLFTIGYLGLALSQTIFGFPCVLERALIYSVTDTSTVYNV